MKMKKLFPFLAFTFFAAFALVAGFQIDPISALAAGASINVISYSVMQYHPGAMAFEFITMGSEYNGEENQDILFRPKFTGDPASLGWRVIFTRATSYKLNFFGPLGKILMPYVKGFQGGSGAPQIQKKMTLAEFKAETSYDKHDYKDTILELITNRDGVNQNDISGTEVAAAEQRLFMDAVQRDVFRNMWLADTTKVHIANGTYPDGTSYAINDADKFYNQIDGVLKKIQDAADVAPASEEIKLTKITAAGIASDEAESVMKAQWRNAPKVLRMLRNQGQPLFYYCSDSFIENYLDTLEADGTEAARTQVINGIERPLYNGIPLLPLQIDEYIESDFAAAFPRDWSILTTPENLGLVLNVSGSWAETRFWFNPDENENRQRSQFHLGVDYVLPELMSVAFNKA